MSKWPNWKFKLENPLVEGGLRLNGFVKSWSSVSPLISYVTVVRNSQHTIERTIKSVQSQTYQNVEHIIIDGQSTDKTLQIILKYKDKIDYYASEPDSGIYDAINKAVELCNGNLILILNSDDWLPVNSAEFAANMCVIGTPQFISGTAKVLVDINTEIEWQPKVVSSNSYFSVANLNHNSVYASKEAYELSGPYDSSYKIAGDFKWIMACFDSGVQFNYTNAILANYSLGGTSSDIYWHIEECKRVIKEKYPFLKGNEVTSLNYIYYPWREGFKYLLDGFNPEVEIRGLLEKYGHIKNFHDAIDLNMEYKNSINIPINYSSSKKLVKIKNILSHWPLLYKISRKIYLKIKYSKG